MLNFLPSIINSVTGFFSKKQELKGAKQSAKDKLKAIKVSGSQNIKMTDAEWESLSVQTQNDSWKDEYVTLIITCPILLILVGAVASALGFDFGPQILNGALDGIVKLKELGMDYGFLVNSVVLAAIGLKVWRA